MPKLGRAEEAMETANVMDAHELYIKRVEALRKSNAEVGWYQDGAGGLYHFDGQVWDVVPEEMTKRLEYLG